MLPNPEKRGVVGQGHRFEPGAVPACVVFCALYFVRFPTVYGSINPDALYYILASQRVADGRVAESMSAFWMPLLPWAASPLVALGVPPLNAVCAVNFAAALVAIIFLFRTAVVLAGHISAQLASVAMASDPQFMAYAVAPKSEMLFVLLTFGAAVLIVRRYLGVQAGESFIARSFWRPVVVLTSLGCLLLLVRIAALPCVLLLGLVVGAECYPDYRRVLAGVFFYFGIVGVLLLGLSSFFHSRTGVFAPSPNWYLNGYLVNREFIAGDYNGAHYSLFDGRNTVEGDVQSLDAGRSLPAVPPVRLPTRLRYLAECVENFVLGWGRVVALPILALAAVGVWSLAQRKLWRIMAWLSMWVLASTIGMIFSNIQQRFFLPALAVFYLLAALGAAVVFSEFRGRFLPLWVAAFLLLTNVAAGFRESGLEALFVKGPERPRPSAGEYIRSHYGPNRRIMTPMGSLANLASAAQTAGYWRPAPMAGAAKLQDYVREKRIEFVIVPARELSEVDAPELRRMLETYVGASLDFRNPYEEVWRIAPN